MAYLLLKAASLRDLIFRENIFCNSHKLILLKWAFYIFANP